MKIFYGLKIIFTLCIFSVSTASAGPWISTYWEPLPEDVSQSDCELIGNFVLTNSEAVESLGEMFHLDDDKENQIIDGKQVGRGYNNSTVMISCSKQSNMVLFTSAAHKTDFTVDENTQLNRKIWFLFKIGEELLKMTKNGETPVYLVKHVTCEQGSFNESNGSIFVNRPMPMGYFLESGYSVEQLQEAESAILQLDYSVDGTTDSPCNNEGKATKVTVQFERNDWFATRLKK